MSTDRVVDRNGRENFWKKRSRHYDELNWAKKNAYLRAFIEVGEFEKDDIVLDVGTGTGIIAHSVSPLVNQVIGLDISQDMLDQSNWDGNLYFIRRDVLDPIFCDNVFDKVAARMVFHHIIRSTQGAMNECYRVLKKGGKMIFSEGVPPSKAVRKEYVEIFKLKEERLTFYREDLENLMVNAGFRKIEVSEVVLKRMSVWNWLKSSGLPKAIQMKIYDLHKNASDIFKRDYAMVETDNDCLINMKMLILVGKK